MKYQIAALDPEQDRVAEDDPEFEHLPEAASYILAQATDEELWGIWTDQDHNSELLCIVYQGDVFRK